MSLQIRSRPPKPFAKAMGSWLISQFHVHLIFPAEYCKIVPHISGKTDISNKTAKMARIIIVEDDALQALSAKQALEAMGHDVVGTAYDAAHAIRLIEGQRPDLVLMDIMLQGKTSGIDLTRLIKSRYDAKVIFITARTDIRTLSIADQAGHSGFISKPFEDYQLIDTINKALL